jgi:hypothetical protein
MKLRAIFCLLLFWGLATGGGARAASPEATSDFVSAIASNKPAAARAALEAGADINAVTPAQRAQRAGNAGVTALLAAR